MKKWFTRWNSASLLLAGIIVSVVVGIKGLLTDNVMNSIISGTVFVALGVIVAILQWLFPLQGAPRPSTRERGFLVFSTVVTFLLVAMLIGGPGVFVGTFDGGNSGQTGGNNYGGSSNHAGITPTPTATPTPVPAGQVVYQATFDQTDFGNWNGDNTRQWKIVGPGEMGSDGSADGQSKGSFIIWYQHDMPTRNYAVEAKITFVRGTETDSYHYHEFGLLVRGDGNKSGYEGGIVGSDSTSSCKDYQRALIAYVQQDASSSYDCGSHSFQHVAYTLDNDAHTYRFEARYNGLQFFIDGQAQPLLSTTDNTLLGPGRVGLRAVYADVNVLSFKVIAL